MGIKGGTLVRSLALATALVAAPFSSFAATLQVSPISIEVVAPGATTTVTLGNVGEGVINAQVRVFKWTQENGQEKLTPTTDVVASPPALHIKQGENGTVRIVRLSKATITGEETYRLLVDEIPPPPKTGTEAVAFAVRHNIPVFFQAAGLSSKLAWKATTANGALQLSATNSGLRHVRLAQLTVSSNGVSTSFNNGLAGYVLGGGANAWVFKTKAIKAGATLKITALGNDGPVEATAQVQPGN